MTVLKETLLSCVLCFNFCNIRKKSVDVNKEYQSSITKMKRKLWRKSPPNECHIINNFIALKKANFTYTEPNKQRQICCGCLFLEMFDSYSIIIIFLVLFCITAFFSSDYRTLRGLLMTEHRITFNLFIPNLHKIFTSVLLCNEF